MVDKGRALTAGATLLIAAAVGHFMQLGDAIAERTPFGSSPKVEINSAPPGSQLVAALPTPPREVIMPSVFSPQNAAPASRVVAVTFAIDTNLQNDAQVLSFAQVTCTISLTALPEPGAIVRLRLDAPCRRNQRILIEHAGLEFADVVGADGGYMVDIPVLQAFGELSVTFAEGITVDAKTVPLTTVGYDRVEISWRGGPGLHIHALEYDADYGDAGHVWADAPRSGGARAQAEGGSLVQLGNPDVLNPRLAEVYSFPIERAPRDGTVRLVVEAEVTPATCGKEMVGRMIQLSGTGDISDMKFSLDMPDCGGAGGYLVLKNLVQDLKIVRN